MKNRDELEDLIRRSVRLQKKLYEEGILLHFTLSYTPCEPKRQKHRHSPQSERT